MVGKVYENYNLQDEYDLIKTIVPKGYNVAAMTVPISEIKGYPDKTTVSTVGYIDSFECVPMGAKLTKIKAKLYKDGESVPLGWITSNQGKKKMLFSLKQKTKDENLIQVTAKVSSFNASSGMRIVLLEQPKIEAIGGVTKSKAGVIVPEPQYLLKKDTTYFDIKTAFRRVLKRIEEGRIDRTEMLPVSLEKEFKLQPLAKSIKFMHGFMPLPVEKFDNFIKYNGFEKRIHAERIWSILKSSSKEKIVQSESKIKYEKNERLIIDEIHAKLPFELTSDQLKSIDSFMNLISTKNNTKSLVYGDVGSGKTLVALITAYVQSRLGFQVALIAPTSILSIQHYEEAVELFGEENVVHLTSKTKIKEKSNINRRLANGEPLIVIGGTSINNLKFTNLSTVYIDEEQKIGVEAKDFLYKKFDINIVFMTATPIPRTLASAVFTNFNVFQIKTKPKNRLPRITKIFKFGKRDLPEIEKIGERMLKGEQTLIIVPSIDYDEMVNAKDVEIKYKKLFPNIEIKIINGKMKKDEVDKIILSYMKNDFPILIATVMIDSGFSNKNITSVFIEGADRFGMSQLHQIRGRCGRGELQGFCYLVPSKGKMSEATKERLTTIEKTEDGFELSQKDIELRGSGELDSIAQSGNDLNFLEWIDEIPIMKKYIKENA